MGFTVGLIGAMGVLMAIVLALIAISPGALDGATEMIRSNEIPKLDRISLQEPMMEVIEPEEPMISQTMEPKTLEPEKMMKQKEPLEMEKRMMALTHSVSMVMGSGAPGCEVKNECYIPSLIEINEGDTVIWSNDDSAAHTVTSGTPSDGPDGMFDSSLVMAGNTFEFTFEDKGEYDYFCIVHPWMTGSVKVFDSEKVSDEMMKEKMVNEVNDDMIKKPEMMETPKTAPINAVVSMAMGSGAPGCEVNNECYIPYSASIAKGGTITWSNDDSAAHTVTSGTPSDGPDGMFDSSLVMAGNTFEFTFEDKGEYDYFCIVHPWMTGKVVVS